MKINFVFLGEGSSDDGLIPHLQDLCIKAGATEVAGVAPDFRRLKKPIGHSVAAKLKAARILEPDADLIFVHRDADGRTASKRYEEINTAAANCECSDQLVAVVPVQELEAWLLLDENAIRCVAGRPRGAMNLNLPRPDALERTARPKETLMEVLAAASEATGRKLERVRADFSRHRRTLLEGLATSGAIERLASWQQLRTDVTDALTRISSSTD